MLKDLKELEKFFKLCRKQGVIDISFDGITVKFGDLPMKNLNQIEAETEVSTDEMSPEELMFYAVQGQS